jgi:N-methylhydantoinase A
MEKALRVISIEKGHDPHDFSLFSFGGAGGLHAVELARQMGIPKVIICKYASTLSAYGMLTSDVIKDYVKTVMLPGITVKELIDNLFTPLADTGRSDLLSEGIASEKIELLPSVDLRYTGQSYELNIPYQDSFIADFHSAHHSAYGYSYPDRSIEIVNLRVRAIGKVVPIRLPRVSMNYPVNKPVLLAHRQVHLAEIASLLPVYDYDALLPGTQLPGPALIISSDTTILIGQNDILNVDSYLNLLIDVSPDVVTSRNNADIQG